MYARPTLCPTLVGREHEITVVGQAVESAHNGLGSSILLLGEAGVGKSRLAREARSLGQQQRMLALWGRCVDGGQSTPYRPFSEALLAGLRGEAPPEVHALRPFKPMLGRLIPHWHDEAADVAESSVVLLGEAVLRLLRILGGDRGTLLVIEDLHWADPETLALIDYVSANLAAEPLLLLGTLRSGEPGPAWSMATSLHSRRFAECIEVRRLSQTEMGLMARACLGQRELPTAVEAALASSAEGLPLLVEDLLAEWAAAGHLSGAGDGWQAQAGESLSHMVPLTFAEIIRRRLAALGQDATALLRLAALLGRSFDWRILPSAVGLDDDQALEVLQRAAQMQLIEAQATEGHAAFRFRHALTQAAILAEILPAQRARLAARLLELIQQAYTGLPGQWCDLAARLAGDAGATEQAATLLLESGRRALSSGALTTAEATLDHARTFCQPGSLLAADVEEKLMEALALAGKHEQVVATGPGLLDALARLNASAERLVQAHLRIARARVAASNWTTAAEHLSRARRLAEACPAALLPPIDALAAHVALGQGQTECAAGLAEAALAGAERASLWEVACEALEVSGRAVRQRDLRQAEVSFDHARRIAEEHGLAIWRLRAIHELGTIDIFTPGAGPERLLQARDLAERAGALGLAAIVDVQLAAMHIASGDFDVVLALAARSADMAQRLGLSLTRATALLFAAEARGRMGPDRPAMEAALELAFQAAKSDVVVETEIHAMAWGDCRAMASLIEGNRSGALRELGKAQEYFRMAQSSAPSPSRGLWALLTSLESGSGTEACAEVAASSARVQLVNQACLHYADAVRAGRQGLVGAAAEAMSAGDALLEVSLPWFLHFGRRFVAEDAIARGWGEPARWLQEGAAFFGDLGQQRLASTCRSLLRKCGIPATRSQRMHPTVPQALRVRGVTGREMEVLSVIGDGLSNREIGARLYVSPKTVEKHISSLMDKLQVRTRAQLAAIASSGAALS